MFLAQDAFSLRYEAERYPAIKMVAIKEYHVAKAAWIRSAVERV